MLRLFLKLILLSRSGWFTGLLRQLLYDSGSGIANSRFAMKGAPLFLSPICSPFGALAYRSVSISLANDLRSRRSTCRRPWKLLRLANGGGVRGLGGNVGQGRSFESVLGCKTRFLR